MARRKQVLQQELPPEPFGRRLARIREDVAHLKMADLADLMADWLPSSTATLSRLESREETPMRPEPRRAAALAAVLCGVDPSTIGLSIDDIPPRIIEELRREGKV